MHLLTPTSTSLDEIVEPVDLAPDRRAISWCCHLRTAISPALAAAWAAEQRYTAKRATRASARSAPPTVGRSLDRQGRAARQGDRGAPARRARLVALRRGSLDALAREHAESCWRVLSGEDRDDPRLAEASTLPRPELGTCCVISARAASENLRALLRRLAGYAGAALDAPAPRPVPRVRRIHRRRPARSISIKSSHATCSRPPGRSDHLLSRGVAGGRHRADRSLCARRCARAGSRPRRWW